MFKLQNGLSTFVTKEALALSDLTKSPRVSLSS